MPIVINDFEVVAEPPAATERGEGGGREEKQPDRPTAEELLHWLRERRERIRAH